MTKWIKVLLSSVFFMTAPAVISKAVEFKPGESIVYDIEKLKMNIGQATLEYKGIQKLDGKDAIHLIFTANAPGFYDQEKIYLDPESFFPLKIYRDLKIFGKKEKITENYFPDEHRVVIVNGTGEKSVSQEIKKNVSIDNIYGIIYRYRKTGSFKIDDTIKAVLPTKEVIFTIEKQQSIKINGNKFDSLYMAGTPENFGFWFSTDENRIPLKINGALGVIKAAMTFKEYHQESSK